MSRIVLLWLPWVMPGWGCAAGGSTPVAPTTSPTPRAEVTPKPTTTVSKSVGPRVVAYKPGIRIDWTARQVEVDAEVILREGALELLACSPQTKEHESLLRVEAVPSHIYEAMGLIGLTPGRPVQWDEENERLIPPSGDAVDLRIRYHQGDRVRTVPAHTWLWDVQQKRMMSPPSWLFTGSHRIEDGRMFADLDGTVVTVVNFASALIALRKSHSADNAELWLEPYSERVPSVDTPCKLLIRAASAAPASQPQSRPSGSAP